ncbi:MAG TPA: DUF938 domain-containing protein [Burkholderiales bacterium]
MRCEHADALSDGRLVSAAAERNRGPILEVLERVLPAAGLVLEIASGTGQHVIHFAAALTGLAWQPSDPDADCRRSIRAWLSAAKLANVREPLDLDVSTAPWPIAAPDAIVCLNMIHIAPWSATGSLFAGAATALKAGGLVFLYGPYFVPGEDPAPGNLAFDRTLRARNPEWGVRNLQDVSSIARESGFDRIETVAMPANNLSVVFRRG